VILNELANYARIRVNEAKETAPAGEVIEQALVLPKGTYRFEKELRQTGLSFICEVKKASPSKGVISEDFPYIHIARDYVEGGAECISCLTEPKWFLGSDQIFADIRKNVALPMIRKDFTIDPYQIYEARLLGADAILLICALLDTKTISFMLEICDMLGISAIVEAHSEDEIRSAVSAGARMIGVNNRNLKDFTVEFENALKLRELVPSDVLYIAESGIRNVADVSLLASIGADAVLIGETLMRSDNRVATLREMKEAAKNAGQDEN